MWWVALALAAPELSPSAVEAGEATTLTWSVTLEEVLREGDRIEVDAPRFSGITWAKWTLGVDDASECDASASESRARRGLVRVATDGDALLSLTLESSTSIHAARSYVIEVEAGVLEAGDTVALAFGGDGDCAWALPARAYPQVRLPSRLWVAGAPQALEDAVLVLVPGALAQAMVVLPSFAVPGEPLTGRLVLLDAEGNPVDEEVEVLLEGSDGEEVSVDGTVLTVTPDAPGVLRLEGTVGGIAVRSNPVWVEEEQAALYWGDLHTHHGLVYTDEDGVLRDDNHDYARDVVGLDFGSHSMKMASTELDGEALFEEQRWACEAYTTDDYVVMLGLEWVGHGEVRHGHHNVYFDDCEGAWAAHVDFDGLATEEGLWAWLDGLEHAQGTRAFTVPHATRFTGFDFAVRDDEARPLAEVFSTWGDSSLSGEGSVRDALLAGQRWGLIGSSDDHEGFLGNPLARKNTQGGLAAVWAEGRTREALFEALTARRTYATSGARILLEVEGYDGAGTYPMGTAWVPGPQHGLVLRVSGTDELAQVAVITAPRDGALSEVTYCEGQQDCALEIQQLFDGETPTAVWVEVDQIDGHRAWSSPLFLHPDCSEEGLLDPGGYCVEETGETGLVDDVPSETDLPPGDCGCRQGSSAWSLWLLPLCWRRRIRSR